MGWSASSTAGQVATIGAAGGSCHIGSPRAWSIATVGAPKNRTIGFQLWRVRQLLTLTPRSPKTSGRRRPGLAQLSGPIIA
jgi:hypothetical protein